MRRASSSALSARQLSRRSPQEQLRRPPRRSTRRTTSPFSPCKLWSRERPMPKQILLETLFLLFVLPPAAAQSLLTLTPKDCAYHPGDDPAWAAPSIDESGWRPYSEWHADLAHPRLGIRCHTNLSELRSAAHPAIQVRLYGAYELYLDGSRVGAAGNLGTGNFRLDVIRSYPLAPAKVADSPRVIALRVFDRSTLYYVGPLRGIVNRPFRLAAGDASLLDALRAQEFVSRARGYSTTVIYYAIVGILCIPLLALYLFDRTRKPVLLLCLASLGLCCSRSNEFAEAAFAGYSISTACIVTIFIPLLTLFTQYPFFFALAGRRMPPLFLILVALPNIDDVQLLFDAFDPTGAAAWFLRFNNAVINPVVFGSVMALSLTPFVVFWPFSAIPRRMRALAILCLAWGAIDFAWYLVAITARSIPNIYARWGLNLLSSRGAATACVVAGLLGLLFRA